MEMQHQSFWRLEKPPEFSALPGDMDVNTVIVGAGMSGLLCAYFLHQRGVRDIAVIDAGGVCGGVTANTTAKITSQHGLIYARLLGGLGGARAAQYLAANERAVRSFAEIISREKIDCGFTRANAWVYAATDSGLREVEDEIGATRKLGAPAVFDTKTELPFPVKGAIMLPGQAYFHPLKFAHRICEILAKAGCKIYTRTAATGVGDGAVNTDRGNIRAKNIVCCSHYPFIDKSSLMFTRVFQERSYVLALKHAGAMRDMYLDCADGGFSFRPHGDMLLFGAYDHKTGHEDEKLHFDHLMLEAAKLYPEAKTAWMWSAQDCMTHDKIPYIGRWPGAGKKTENNIFIATGFNKWGMTSAMAAADVISGLITTGKHEHEDAFCINRGDVGLQAKSFVKEAVDIAGNFLAHLVPADKDFDDIGDNEGGIVEIAGRRVGVYRDNSGKIHAVRPVCTHMGCAVKWNKDENTWDCTCHGSRFDTEGNVINGPAQKPLDRFGIRIDL